MVNNIFAKIEYKLVFARMYRTFLRSLVKVFLIRTSQFSVVIREFPTHKAGFLYFFVSEFSHTFPTSKRSIKKQYFVSRKNNAKKPQIKRSKIKCHMYPLQGPGV
jgi:cell shape-determining protein MreC